VKHCLKFLVVFFACGLASCSRQTDMYRQPMGYEVPSSLFSAVQQISDYSQPRSVKNIRVGMLLPLSGKYKNLGENLRNAGLLAQFDINSDSFELLFYDTKGTADGAKEAFNQAIDENVQIILGPVLAEEVGAVRRARSGRDVPVISFTSDTDKVGKGVYTMALLLSNQAERIVRYACEEGKKRLAILAPDDPSGDIAIETAQKTAKQCGMEVTKLAVYNPTFINYEPYVLSVLPESVALAKEKKEKERLARKQNKDLPPPDEEQEPAEEEIPIAEQLEFDCLFIADTDNRLKSIASLFALYDVTPDVVPFLGMSTWREPSLTQEGALVNARFSDLPMTGFKSFAQKYKDTYRKEPVRLASLTYDAVALAYVLGQEEAIHAASITRPNGFSGVDGLFRFNKDGTSERLLGISKIVARNTFGTIERPARTFDEEAFLKEGLDDIRLINEWQAHRPILREPELMMDEADNLTTAETSAADDGFVDEADMIDVTPTTMSD